MIYNVQGKLFMKGETVTSTGKTGKEWKRRNFVLEIQDGQWTEHMSIDATDTRADQLDYLELGDEVKVGFVISAREWQGRWFNDLRMVSIEALRPVQAPKAQEPAEEWPAAQKGDLPF